MSGAVVNGGFAEESVVSSGASSPDQESTPVRKESSGVSQRVEAFQQKFTESPPGTANVTRTGSKTAADYPSDVQEARVNRDVETLNRCVEEIETFIYGLKEMNEARKKLNRKGRKSSKKKYERTRTIAAGPNEAKLSDIYQKFKYAFNMLGRLKPHISNPNAPELVHYLMVPLDIIVKMTGLEAASSVMVPWLSIAAIDLLSNCLNTRETAFWKTLGNNWNLPHSSPVFKDADASVYVPVFKDGWSPPDIIVDDRNAAAAKSAAAMVARMKGSEFGTPKTKHLVAKAVQKFRGLAQEAKAKNEEKRVVVEAETKVAVEPEPEPELVKAVVVKKSVKAEEKPRAASGNGKMATVAYDYWAHNVKELTIRAGEKVMILDDSRRWWLVRNDHDEQGFVPFTVLELPSNDTNSDSSSADGSSSTNSPYGTASSSLQVQLKTQAQQEAIVENGAPPEPKSPTVVTAKSIITESAQFSPAPPVAPKPTTPTKEAKPEPEPEPPAFIPPPPPEPVPDSPRLVVTVPVLKKSESQEKETEVVASPVSPTSPPPPTLQTELNSILTQPVNGNTLQTSDGVDFYIPLFKSSTADDVSRWLKKLGFEPLTIERLKGTAAKELFKMPEEDLVTRLGEAEGKRLANELEAQIGAQTRHKTMTEFQKALVQRMKRQETIQKKVMTQVVVKSPEAGKVPSQEDMQKKFIEQQALLKAQQSKENSAKSHEPEKPSFTSFSAPTTNNNEVTVTVGAPEN